LSDNNIKPYPGIAPAGWQDMTFRELLAIDAKIARNRGADCRYELQGVVALKVVLEERIGRAFMTLPTDLAKLGANTTNSSTVQISRVKLRDCTLRSASGWLRSRRLRPVSEWYPASNPCSR
jgi:hypothetical protein